jgi:hypothetical protein
VKILIVLEELAPPAGTVRRVPHHDPAGTVRQISDDDPTGTVRRISDHDPAGTVRRVSDHDPAGTVRRVSGDDPAARAGGEFAPTAFAGWLGLLRALDEVIGLPDDPPPPDLPASFPS